MGIQNIDFAKKIELNEKESKPLKQNNKKNKVSWYFIIFFLGFTFGFYSGYQIFKLKHLEENLVKNPDTLDTNESKKSEISDTKNADANTFSNISTMTGDYIVFLGVYNAKRSSEIIKYLENKKVFDNHKFYPCSNLNDFNTSKSNGSIYRIPIENGKYHKILIGCFIEKIEADNFLKELIRFNKDFFNKSEVYLIQE